jgi:thymidine phosphorylase
VERFAKMVVALGGPHDLIECPASYLAIAPVIRAVTAQKSGVVAGVDVRAVGMTVTLLGGGRMQPSDTIDYSVGFDRLAAIGEAMEPGTPLGRVHARTATEAEMGAARLRAAYAIGERAPGRKLIVERISVTGAV